MIRPAILVLFCVIYSPLIYAETDWFKDDKVSLCKDKPTEADCVACRRKDRRVMMGGYGSTRFFFSASNSEYAIFHHMPCIGGASCGGYEVEGKEVSCEAFVQLVQKKQKDCNDCLEVETAHGK